MSSPQFADPKSEDDPLLSPIFLSSGDDITSTSSSSNSSSHDSGSPRNDWLLPSNANINIVDSAAAAIWPGSGQFNMNFPSDQQEIMDLDMDFTSLLPFSQPQFSIDPNALHFGGHVYGTSCGTNESGGQETLENNCDPTFQFSLSQSFEDHILSSPDMSSDAPSVHLIPSPVVASPSRSPSPFVPSPTDPQTTRTNPSELTLISQLNQRVRDAAGVTLAVPMGPDVLTSMAPTAFHSLDGQIQTPVSSVPSMSPMPYLDALSPSKVAIPRLRPAHLGQQSAPNPSINTDIPTLQQAHTDPMICSLSNQPPQLTKAGRPKTSHTTIERRYRTNLNARILALRRAVPALRILERNIPNSGITQGKGLTGASAPKSEFNDVVNERGYVDGVKAAKKNSKGVVLGKAVEYIKVLKRREIRLRRETDGLKALLSGLVGGPDLLAEWEKEWRAKFGGEEMDEVDEDAEDDMDGDEGDDDDDEGDEEDSEGGRKVRPKKRGKTDSSASSVKAADKKLSPGAVPAGAPQTGEKRKRGRPRKIQTPPTNLGVPKLLLHPPNVSPATGLQSQVEPPKYLLAAFVLFNFFSNSPFSPARTSSAPSNTHEGTVLTHSSINPIDTSASNWTWLSFQFVNTLVSVLLLIFLLSDAMKKKLGSPLRIFGAAAETEKSHAPPRIGVIGLVKAAILRYTKIVNASTNEHDLNSWRSIAEKMVLNPSSTSLISAVQTYLSFSPVVTSHSRVLSDHITLALLSHAFSLCTAQKRWANLQGMIDKQGMTKPSAPERLALSLELPEAIRILEETKNASFPNDTPVKKIARYLILKATKNLAAKEWLNCVNSDDDDETDVPESENRIKPRDTIIPGSSQQALVLEAGKQLGGKIGELVTMLERCRIPGSGSHLWSESAADSQITDVLEENDEQESGSSIISSSSEELSSEFSGQEFQTEEIEDTRNMLLATVLYKQIFSPNATPVEGKTSVNPSNVLALRRTLASAAFDCSPETEDARDKVVDVLAEMGKALNYRREL